MAGTNYHVRRNDPEVLQTLKEEYESMGRDTKIEGNTLTVFALKQEPKTPKQKRERRPRPERD